MMIEIKHTDLAAEVIFKGDILRTMEVELSKKLGTLIRDGNLIIDLAQVPTAHSLFYGTLLKIQRRAEELNHHIILSGCIGSVWHMIQMTELNVIIEVTEKLSAARTLMSKLIDRPEPVG